METTKIEIDLDVYKAIQQRLISFSDTSQVSFSLNTNLYGKMPAKTIGT